MKEKLKTTGEGSYCHQCGIWIPKYAGDQRVLIGGVYHLGCVPKNVQQQFDFESSISVD